MKPFVIIPGDGYEEQMMHPFMKYIRSLGYYPIYVPLIEESEDVTYDDLSSRNYAKYIDKHVKSKSILYGVSKGCHWATVYSTLYPSKVKRLILVEPTTMEPSLLVAFETYRGNAFVKQYYDIDDELDIDSTGKAIDTIVSDRRSYIPKCPILIIWTSIDSSGNRYSPRVINLKRRYIQYLKINGANVIVKDVEGPHCLDLHPKYFQKIIK